MRDLQALGFIKMVTLPVVTMDAVRTICWELKFFPAESVPEPGPYVYQLVDADECCHYPGSSGRQDASQVRLMQYAKFTQALRAMIEAKGLNPNVTRLSTIIDAEEWIRWSPIVRYVYQRGLTVMAASVAGTGDSARQWEARLQALGGAFTDVESLQGGAAWEANYDTLRGEGYRWVRDRLMELRDQGVFAASTL
ncbi:hypothetical protein [Nocardia sp. IFM 10818]